MKLVAILIKLVKLLETFASPTTQLKTETKRDAPSYGVYILAYEWVIEKLLDRRKGEVPTPFQSIWVGGIAG